MKRDEAAARRRAAERRGRRAETAAAWLLRLKGYRVLARRYRTPAGEIDLIVRRGRSVVFVEVKERPDEIAALEAITHTARQRIARAAALWVSRNPAAANLDQRFDVILACPGRFPRHMPAIFDSGGNVW
jgi:putative endonuclease